MHMAAQGGQLEVIKFFVRKFEDRVYEGDKDLSSMLHWAAHAGHCEVARYLIVELKMDPLEQDKVCEVGRRRIIKMCFKVVSKIVCFAVHCMLPVEKISHAVYTSTKWVETSLNRFRPRATCAYTPKDKWVDILRSKRPV